MFTPKIPVLLKRLKDHLKIDPATLPVIEQRYDFYHRANIHLGIETLSKSSSSPYQLIGIVLDEEYRSVSLAKLSRATMSDEVDEGPIEYVDEALPNGKQLSCVKRGLYLLRYDDNPVALLVTEQHMSRTSGIYTEVMAISKQAAENFSHHLSKLILHGSAFRGQVLSLQKDCFGNLSFKFHQLPNVDRAQIILPEELLQRVERQTIGFSHHAHRLAAAGRHLKRGILLHGPPGTGKTFSAMYLASRMPGRTVFLLTGAGLGSIEAACNMARILQPTTIILEDVDLIGTQRENQMVDANALLFELLNQMDGLADDADILFILTTNRPDVLEPALAARPGRIDQAIEIPLPDEDCRKRLFLLYSNGLTLNVSDLDAIIKKIEGVSAAFIRELLRRSAVFAAMHSSGDIVVEDEHIRDALAELVIAGGPLTQRLLGAKSNF